MTTAPKKKRGRGSVVQRIVNGRDYPITEFKELVMAALMQQPKGIASADWVIQSLNDPSWRTPAKRKEIYDLLFSMSRAAKPRIEQTERGVFTVTKAYEVRGLDGPHELERHVIAFLKANGGLAKRSELVKHFGYAERYEAQNFDRMLKRSAKVRRDFNIRDRAPIETIPENRPKPLSNVVGAHVPETRVRNKRYRLAREQGFFNLHPDQLHKMILQARWAHRYFRLCYWSLPGIKQEGDAQTAAEETDLFLRAIGRRIQRLREYVGWDLDEIVERTELRTALNAAIFRYSRKDRFLHRLAGENPATGEFADAHEVRVLFFARIEGGDDENGIDLFRFKAHAALRDDFWIALADLFNLDPVALSRGLMMPSSSLTDDADWDSRIDDETDTILMLDDDQTTAEEDETTAEEDETTDSDDDDDAMYEHDSFADTDIPASPGLIEDWPLPRTTEPEDDV